MYPRFAETHSDILYGKLFGKNHYLDMLKASYTSVFQSKVCKQYLQTF